jgi:hypothetical protein
MKLTHYKFRLGLGLLFAALGLTLTIAAIGELVGARPHGLGHFYEVVFVGPMLFIAGVGCCFDKNDA